LATWKSYIDEAEKTPKKKSFFKKKGVSEAQMYLSAQRKIPGELKKEKKMGKATKIISIAVSGAMMIVTIGYLIPILSKMNIAGTNQVSWQGYSVPACPGGTGMELSESTLTPDDSNSMCFLTSKNTGEIVQYYDNQMQGWDVKVENTLTMGEIVYYYKCWKKENVGAMIYTLEMSGQTTVIASIGAWSGFEGYLPTFLSSEESEEETGEQGPPEMPEQPELPD
jgi:hypothetical protein